MPNSARAIDNTLFFGDCLRVISEEMPADSVDLIYLDPPFNSKRNYNMNVGGKAQATVFRDTWKWSDEQVQALNFIGTHDVDVRQAVDTLIDFVTIVMGERTGLRAYLVYMAARLLACRSLLKETGSIYLHCDPTAGHYLKLLMDAIFGSKNVISQIVWNYGTPSGGRASGKKPVKSHELLLAYAKKYGKHVYNRQYTPYKEKYIKDWFRHIDEDGRAYRTRSRKGKIVRQYLDESPGMPLSNTWSDIMQLYSSAGWYPTTRKELTGLDTQKPLALLERVIRASSKEGDLVFDPFCGCGTAVVAANSLNRRWIGIDVEPMIVDLMARRLREECGIDPNIRGIPYNFEQAERLAKTAPFEFERWALRLVPGAQPNFRQVGDGGLDGRAYVDIKDENGKQPLFGFQVKGGASVGRPAVDAFAGALQKNKCAAGLFIVLKEDIANRLRSSLATQNSVAFGKWTGGQIGVWSVEDWFIRNEVCLAPVPPLVGAGETLGLLKSREWQRGLNMPQP